MGTVDGGQVLQIPLVPIVRFVHGTQLSLAGDAVVPGPQTVHLAESSDVEMQHCGQGLHVKFVSTPEKL